MPASGGGALSQAVWVKMQLKAASIKTDALFIAEILGVDTRNIISA
jgi:hypothetical protein